MNVESHASCVNDFDAVMFSSGQQHSLVLPRTRIVCIIVQAIQSQLNWSIVSYSKAAAVV